MYVHIHNVYYTQYLKQWGGVRLGVISTGKLKKGYMDKLILKLHIEHWTEFNKRTKCKRPQKDTEVGDWKCSRKMSAPGVCKHFSLCALKREEEWIVQQWQGEPKLKCHSPQNCTKNKHIYYVKWTQRRIFKVNCVYDPSKCFISLGYDYNF